MGSLLTAEQEAKIATYLEAWRHADTPKKRAWLVREAEERGETILCDVALMRSTYPADCPVPAATSVRCPSCNSPQPHLHPGAPCPDRFHLTVTPQNTPERVARVQALLIELSKQALAEER